MSLIAASPTIAAVTSVCPRMLSTAQTATYFLFNTVHANSNSQPTRSTVTESHYLAQSPTQTCQQEAEKQHAEYIVKEKSRMWL